MPISAQLVSFPSGNLTLRGYLYPVDGRGPHPAMIWNHGSERTPAAADELAEFYRSRGYVLFAPHRRGHGRSPGAYPIAELRAQLAGEATGGGVDRRRMIAAVIALHERCLADTLAAVAWLARQPSVEAQRMMMSGVSHGGVQTLLAAAADAGMKAYVPFAPAAMAWDGNPELQRRLLTAVRAARAPILLLQAANDYSLGPSAVLGAELERKGEPNRASVWPAYGDTAQSGHGTFACHGTDVWGDEVSAFLDSALAVSQRPRTTA